jgi:hypothetical protein
MKLVSNAGKAHRMYCVVAAVLLGFFDTAYAADWWGLGANIAPNVFAAINAVVATLVIPLLRVIKQFPTGFEETQPMKDDA